MGDRLHCTGRPRLKDGACIPRRKDGAHLERWVMDRDPYGRGNLDPISGVMSAANVEYKGTWHRRSLLTPPSPG